MLLTSTKAACTGKVYLQDQSHLYAVSNDGWSKNERNELCKYLECGKVSETMYEGHVTKEQNFWSRSYSCTGNPNSIWDCEKDKTPVEKRHLHISCTGKGNLYSNSFELFEIENSFEIALLFTSLILDQKIVYYFI